MKQVEKKSQETQLKNRNYANNDYNNDILKFVEFKLFWPCDIWAINTSLYITASIGS